MRAREVGGDSLSSSGRESAPGGGGGRSAGGPETRMESLGVSENPAATLSRNLAPGKGKLGATSL